MLPLDLSVPEEQGAGVLVSDRTVPSFHSLGEALGLTGLLIKLRFLPWSDACVVLLHEVIHPEQLPERVDELNLARAELLEAYERVKAAEHTWTMDPVRPEGSESAREEEVGRGPSVRRSRRIAERRGRLYGRPGY